MMALPSTPDISYKRNNEIFNFIIQCVKDEDSDNEGVRGKRLRELYLDRYLDKDRQHHEEYVTREKIFVIDVIKSMIQENILKSVSRAGTIQFSLHPSFKAKNHVNEVSITRNDGSGEQENRRPPTAESNEAAKEESTREWVDVKKSMGAAYAEMTRGAAPLVSNPQELLFETPNKKRRRVEEIAPSNASSNFDPISPHRYPQSTPRRPLKPNTPQSEARRRSAPSRLFNRPLTPIGQIQDERDLGGMDLKQEKTYTGPIWLIPALEKLHLKYPDDMFKPEGEGIQCLDCEGRIFTLGVHRTVNNFERHLNGKQHRANVTARLLQIEKLGMQDTFVPACIPTTMDFNFPPAPLAVFANKSNSSFESLRSNMNQYFVALENDAASKAVRSNMLEERMAAAEQRSLVQLEKLSDKLVVSEARREENLKHMAEELATTEERSRDRLDRIVEQSAASEERSKTRLEDLSDRLARSDRRCKDEAEDLSVRFAISENSTQARLNQMTERMKSLEQINEKQNEYIHDLESQCQLHSEELQRQREREEELRRTCLAQIELHNQEIVDRLNKSEVAHSEMIHLLEKQFAERFRPLEKAKQEQIEQIEQIERFESIVPEIFQEMQALRERLSKPVKRSVSRRASYHSRPKVRHVSRRVSIIS